MQSILRLLFSFLKKKFPRYGRVFRPTDPTRKIRYAQDEMASEHLSTYLNDHLGGAVGECRAGARSQA